MINNTLQISVDYDKAGLINGDAKMITYILENTWEIDSSRRRPAIVICPGGGYSMTSDREAEPIAVRFNALGFHCFVLRYSCGAMRFPGALLELSRALVMIRAHAEEWNIDADKIIVAGFSAGGHLAASLGVFWNREFVREALGLQNNANRPNGLILGYPVITSGEFGSTNSFKNLLGEAVDNPEKREQLSLENHVSDQTPPSFIWHTYEDQVVPVENSLLFAAALRRCRVPFDLHIFRKGIHGLALASPETGLPNGKFVEDSSQNWPEMAAKWIREL